MLSVLQVVVVLFAFRFALAVENITIEDTDYSNITYYPQGKNAWFHQEHPLDESTYSISYSNQSDVAYSFSFQGTRFAIHGRRQYGRGLVDIVVDNRTAVQADFWRQNLTDKRTSAIFLSPDYPAGKHNVVVQQASVVDSRVGEYPIIMLDYISYLSAAESTSKGGLIGGTIGGILALLVIICLGWYLRKRRKHKSDPASRGKRTVLDDEEESDKSSNGYLASLPMVAPFSPTNENSSLISTNANHAETGMRSGGSAVQEQEVDQQAGLLPPSYLGLAPGQGAAESSSNATSKGLFVRINRVRNVTSKGLFVQN